MSALGPLTRRVAKGTLFLLPILLSPPQVWADRSAPRLAVEPPRSEWFEARLAEQRATASWVRLVSPFYAIDETLNTYLYVVSVFAEPIEIEVIANSRKGDQRSLGSFTLAPTSHRTLSLRELLGDAGEPFQSGSLEVRFWGNVMMIEAWGVLRMGGQYVEWPFSRLGAYSSTTIASFWDTRALGTSVRPRYYLLNPTDAPVEYSLALGQAQRALITETRTLHARESAVLTPRFPATEPTHGWIRIEHGGEPGPLVALGLLTGDLPADRGSEVFLSTLPVYLRDPGGETTDYHALRVPLVVKDQIRGGLVLRQHPSEDRYAVPTRSVLSLYNASAEKQIVTIAAESFETGAPLAAFERTLEPGEILSLEPTRFLRKQMPRPVLAATPEVRLAIRGGTDALRPWAVSLSPAGEVFDIRFLRRGEAHPTGLYALPSLEQFEIVDTLVNVGDDPARIMAQIFWEEGSYSLPPIHIAPGHSYQLDIGEVARLRIPDNLGRTLDPNYRRGYLQWVIQLGSGQILDRMELRRRSGWDVFGFKYNTCCLSRPVGDLIPGSLVLDFGQPASFVASVYIYTCSSIMGPYDAYVTDLNYVSPMSWDAETASANDDTYQIASFEGLGEAVIEDPFDGCIPAYEEYGDEGPVTADPCREEHHPGYDPSQGCQMQSANCSACYACCDKERAVGDCQCSGNEICEQAILATCGTCKQLCFGSHYDTCSAQVTSCL